MMKFENTEIFNFLGALRGMRNPHDSWNNSDSVMINGKTTIGPKDKDLCIKLIKAGPEHRKFLRQIFISVDISAPLYWWKEFSTYKCGTVSNSCSTMHTIHKKEFTPDMFQCENLRGYKRVVEQKMNDFDVDTELWLHWPRDERFLVSNYGRIRRLEYVNTNKRIVKERIVPGIVHSDGYVFITVPNGNEGSEQVPKHRMIAETWLIDSYKDGYVIDHIDGNKQNNAITNLEWVSQAENIKRSIKNNLQPKNVVTYTGKLTAEQRNQVIEDYGSFKYTRRELAKKYNVSHTTINSIINHKYDYGENCHNEYQEFLKLLDTLNELRTEYLETKDKEVWLNIIQLLPNSFIQKRTITMNYENLLNICKQRQHHKLKEWSIEFINWAKSIPYSKEFIFDQIATTK